MLRSLITFVLMAVVLYFAVVFFREKMALVSLRKVLDLKALVFYAVALNLYALVNLPYLCVAGAKLRLLTGKATDEDRALMHDTMTSVLRVLPWMVLLGCGAAALANITRYHQPKTLWELLASVVSVAAYGGIFGLVFLAGAEAFRVETPAADASADQAADE